MLPGRLALAPPSSFELLAKLLQGADPQSFPIGNAPVAMTVGEPRDAPPPFIAEIIHAHRNDFGRYPPIAGTVGFRAAVADWLRRRFNLPATAIDPDRQILPLNGSREGLFFAVPPLVPDSKNGGRPATKSKRTAPKL